VKGISVQKRAWILILVLQILAGLHAGVVFKVFEKPLAGTLASTVFVIVGFLTLRRSTQSQSWWYPLPLVATVFLGAFAGPLWIKRIMTGGAEAIDHVAGIPIELFHKGSTICFGVMAGLTLIEVLKQKGQSADRPK
jgi:hypothetical protein